MRNVKVFALLFKLRFDVLHKSGGLCPLVKEHAFKCKAAVAGVFEESVKREV